MYRYNQRKNANSGHVYLRTHVRCVFVFVFRSCSVRRCLGCKRERERERDARGWVTAGRSNKCGNDDDGSPQKILVFAGDESYIEI